MKTNRLISVRIDLRHFFDSFLFLHLHRLAAFNPSATSKDAHHILLFGCSEPGSDDEIWNCGEMSHANDHSKQNYKNGPTCKSGTAIIYAWALDADKTELPKGVK